MLSVFVRALCALCVQWEKKLWSDPDRMQQSLSSVRWTT